VNARSGLTIGALTLVFFAFVAIGASGGSSGKTFPDDNRGARPNAAPDADDVIPTAEMIGEGVISTDDDELGGGVTPDGKTLIFEKSAAPHYLYIMCESHLADGNWGQPEILPFSGQYRDTDPVVAPDGQSILFASDRPVRGKDLHRWSIWRAQRTATAWEDPKLVPGAVNAEGSQVFASIAANGNIYFASDRKTGSYDVFRAKLVDGEYKEAEDLGPAINGQGIATFEATIAPDESYLLLGSFGRQPGLGSSDLYVSFNDRGVWGTPVNLGPEINTRARDYSPRISGDGTWLYFTSERGFLDEKREQPYTMQSLSDSLASVTNGLGNLYRIPLEPVLKVARKQSVVKSQNGNRPSGPVGAQKRGSS
jgi:WD40-like Beta Propeller Repeat